MLVLLLRPSKYHSDQRYRVVQRTLLRDVQEMD